MGITMSRNSLHTPACSQRIDAARGNGQIDGAPVADLVAAHVRAPFVEDHREPPLSKRDGKQRPH